MDPIGPDTTNFQASVSAHWPIRRFRHPCRKTAMRLNVEQTDYFCLKKKKKKNPSNLICLLWGFGQYLNNISNCAQIPKSVALN